jgi:hypothetical protein
VSSSLPWSSISEDGVEHCEKLSGDRDERHHLGLSSSDEALMEGLQDRPELRV